MVESIREWGLKIKTLTEERLSEWAVPIIVILVGFSSFGLGRLSGEEASRPLITITEAPTKPMSQALVLGGEFVASRTGSVYYYPWCTGVSKIAAQNRVWFNDQASAERAGYEAAKNCKGLAP